MVLYIVWGLSWGTTSFPQYLLGWLVLTGLAHTRFPQSNNAICLVPGSAFSLWQSLPSGMKSLPKIWMAPMLLLFWRALKTGLWQGQLMSLSSLLILSGFIIFTIIILSDAMFLWVLYWLLFLSIFNNGQLPKVAYIFNDDDGIDKKVLNPKRQLFNRKNCLPWDPGGGHRSAAQSLSFESLHFSSSLWVLRHRLHSLDLFWWS